MKFSDFPTELQSMIMSHLSPPDLCRIVAPVSKHWRNLAYDRFIWKELDFNYKSQTNEEIIEILYSTRPSRVNFSLIFFYLDWLNEFPICNSIRELNLDCCVFSEICIKRFAQIFPNIRTLRVREQQIVHSRYVNNIELNGIHDDDSYINELLVCIAKNLECLEELHVSQTESVSESSILSVAGHHEENLKKITLPFNNLSRLGYHALFNCQKLTHLTIFWPSQMTDVELLLIVQNLKCLSSLSINHSERLFSEVFCDLFEDVVVPGLVKLEINNCCKFNDDALKTIVLSLPRIKSLSLRNLTNVSDVGLKLLIEIAENLESLSLYNIESVSENCAYDLARNLPKLRTCNISLCPVEDGGAFAEVVDGRR